MGLGKCWHTWETDTTWDTCNNTTIYCYTYGGRSRLSSVSVFFFSSSSRRVLSATRSSKLLAYFSISFNMLSIMLKRLQLQCCLICWSIYNYNVIHYVETSTITMSSIMLKRLQLQCCSLCWNIKYNVHCVETSVITMLSIMLTRLQLQCCPLCWNVYNYNIVHYAKTSTMLPYILASLVMALSAQQW